jgi:hypothetical protein
MNTIMAEEHLVTEYNEAIESVIGFYGIEREYAIRYYWDEVEAYVRMFDREEEQTE